MWVAFVSLWGLGLPAGEVPTPPSVVQWTTAPGCPDGAVVRERVSVLLGPRPGAPVWRAQGAVESRGDGYLLQLDLDVGGVHEHRELQASDCALLTNAAALVIAVTVDARATAATFNAPGRTPAAPDSEPDTPTVPPQLPLAPSPQEPPPPVPPSPTQTPPIGASVGLSGGMSAGIIPRIAGGLEGSFGLHIGQARVVLAGYHWFATNADADAQTEVGIRSAASGGSLRGCYALSEGRVDIPLCSGIDLAVTQGRGQGTNVNPQSFRDLWVGAVVSAGVQLRVARRFALTARVDGIAALRRPAAFLTIEGQPQEVFRSAPAALRVVAGPIFFLRR